MFRRSLITVALGLAVLALAPAAALASDITVSTCDEASFTSAVAGSQPGDRIVFDCDGTITLTSQVDVPGDLEVDGNGHDVTISGGGTTRIFNNFQGRTLTVRHLKLADGIANDVYGGGAIYNSGSVVVDDVEFVNNQSTSAGGAIDSELGGAQLSVTDSTFRNNYVPDGPDAIGGGAIALFQDTTAIIRTSVFRGNSSDGAGNGGAILGVPATQGMFSGTIDIADTTFLNNIVERTSSSSWFDRTGGGAVAVYNHGLKVAHTIFSGNTAGGPGAALGGAVVAASVPQDPGYEFPLPSASIADSRFTGNGAFGTVAPGNAYGVGGGVAADGLKTAVTNSSFSGNTADQGGGLAAQSGELAITGSDISANKVQGNNVPLVGAGVASRGVTTFADSHVADNTGAGNCGVPNGSGGSFVDGHGNTETPGDTCDFGETTPPKITVYSPVDGGVYTEGTRVLADFDCDDGTSGSGIASCTATTAAGGALNTSGVGEHSFRVAAVDNDGNKAAATVVYNVVPAPAKSSTTGASGSSSAGGPAPGPAPAAVPLVSDLELASQALGVPAYELDGVRIGGAKVFVPAETGARLLEAGKPLRIALVCDQACDARLDGTVLSRRGHATRLTATKLSAAAGTARVLTLRPSKRSARRGSRLRVKLSVAIDGKRSAGTHTWRLA